MFSFVTDFLFGHVEAVIGYAICVLFPVPWLNSAIISIWSKAGSAIVSAVKSALSNAAPTGTK